jgi:D-3-phosphoglycerate dehydrogenase
LTRDFTIVVIEPIHKSGIEILQKHAEVIQLPIGSTEKDLLKVSEQADAFITRGFVRISSEVLKTASRLKVVGVHGAGVDHIDTEFAHKRSVRIIRTPEAPTDTVAEFTVGLMLSLLRKIPMADATVRRGNWHKKYIDLVGVDLKGETVGIVGLGRIGSAVAKKLKAFETNLIYYKRARAIKVEKQLGAEYVTLNQLLRKSDIISLHVPLTVKTRHMISHEEFGLMRRGVYIVNTSRGAVIDEQALCDALASGKVAGAALDVFESEPLHLDSRLMKLENVILTPHLAATSEEALKRMATAVAKGVVRALRSV